MIFTSSFSKIVFCPESMILFYTQSRIDDGLFLKLNHFFEDFNLFFIFFEKKWEGIT